MSQIIAQQHQNLFCHVTLGQSQQKMDAHDHRQQEEKVEVSEKDPL